MAMRPEVLRFPTVLDMTQANSDRVSLESLQQKVTACTRCPRLIRYCRNVAQEKRRMYRDQEYWGRPLPSFGDPQAELLILGLAPAAHGGNRTGRMFTGDRSGDFLYRALYETGFANQPQSIGSGDGLQLSNCYITASLRCAPPGNKPTPQELRSCRPYLIQELHLLKRVRAVLALGRIAFDTYLRVIYDESVRGRGQGSRLDENSGDKTCEGLPPRSSWQFAHGASFELPGGLPHLFASYHPRRQKLRRCGDRSESP